MPLPQSSISFTPLCSRITRHNVKLLVNYVYIAFKIRVLHINIPHLTKSDNGDFVLLWKCLQDIYD